MTKVAKNLLLEIAKVTAGCRGIAVFCQGHVGGSEGRRQVVEGLNVRRGHIKVLHLKKSRNGKVNIRRNQIVGICFNNINIAKSPRKRRKWKKVNSDKGLDLINKQPAAALA